MELIMSKAKLSTSKPDHPLLKKFLAEHKGKCEVTKDNTIWPHKMARKWTALVAQARHQRTSVATQ
jgi:hypothetical protein